MTTNNAMLDIETLSTRADGVILSIGAVHFNLDTGNVNPDGFYQQVSLENNLKIGRFVDADTLKWWMSQPEDARTASFSGVMPLVSVLQDLRQWLVSFGVDEHGVPSINPWGNGASFDLVMLSHAAACTGVGKLWQHWNERCFRTLKNMPGAERVAKPKNALPHHPMADAYSQAVHACMIWKEIFA